ncbi:pilus assembly PilX family protein [Aidingimonas lacisalsi]|uniref:pilus assembly PilX family protein n=1 Tax=Aidingimonas lacisalsi TaxID=2604086 RepID=UPI001375F3C7|nr:pilus assembly PilX N-terminal domain-containing protein [Aidingimonas lacisalsi]
MALVISLVLLAIALVSSVMGMKTSLVEERMAGNQRAGVLARLAAEYGASTALENVDFLGMDREQCQASKGSTSVSDAVAKYEYRACKTQGGGVVALLSKGKYGGMVRQVDIEYVIPEGFLGLSPLTIPGPLEDVGFIPGDALNTGESISSVIDGRRYPPIAARGKEKTIVGVPGDKGSMGNVSRNISESILNDPTTFHGFISLLHDLAEQRERLFSSGSGVHFGGENDGRNGGRLTYIAGDLHVDSPLFGKGILVVDGNLEVKSSLDYQGLIVVMGDRMNVGRDSSGRIDGAVIVSPFVNRDDAIGYGVSSVKMAKGSRLDYMFHGVALDDAFVLLANTQASNFWRTHNESSRKPGVMSWRQGDSMAGY